MPEREEEDPKRVMPLTIPPSSPKENYKYQCPQCDFPPSTSKNSIKSHIIKEHGGKLLQCEYCSKQSANPDVLRKHMLEKHPEHL